MSKEQTAVEWQFEQLFNSFEKFNNGEYSFNEYLKSNLEIRHQAKQMEKVQIIKSAAIAFEDMFGSDGTNYGVKYYESKYGKDE